MATAAFQPSHQQFRTSAVHTGVTPFKLICRREILIAFHVAKLTKEGKPTEAAQEALEWIQARTDWTRFKCAPPPPELRAEFVGTFEWACRWLGEDPDYVRQHGLPKDHVHGCWSHGRTGGVPAILAHWRTARRTYLHSRNGNAEIRHNDVRKNEQT